MSEDTKKVYETMKPIKLRGYEFNSDLVDRYAHEGKILLLYLAYNNECDLSCPFCFTEGGKKILSKLTPETTKARPLKYDELIALIDQGVELGIKSVCFYGEGEPLLKKDLPLFFKLVNYVNDNHLIPVVFTNGVSVTESIAKKLFDENVSVVGKLYSFNSKINELLVGNHGIYKYQEFRGKEVPSHIPNLMHAGYEKSDRFALFTVVTKYNYAEIKSIWEWERNNGIIPYVDFLYTYKDEEKFGISDEERKRLCRSIYEYDKSIGFDYKYHIGPHLGNKKCNANVAAAVGVNGELRICPAVHVFVGDTRTKSLAELLQERSKIETSLHFRCEDRGRCGAYRLEEAMSLKIRQS